MTKPSNRAKRPKSSGARQPLSLSTAPAANFWDVGTYKRCIKRIDDGATLIDDFKAMIQERASIERRYATLLKDWKKKWEIKLEKGPENKESSLYMSWQEVLTEATATSSTHAEMDTKLTGLANRHVATWRKTHLPKGRLGRLKAARKAEDGFEKAQKQFARLRGKFDKAHKTYTTTREAVDALTRKQADRQLSREERVKIVEKTTDLQMSRDQEQFKCRQRLEQLKEDLPRYQAGMRETFTYCQGVEQKRIEFVKHALDLYVQALEPGIAAVSVENARAALSSIESGIDVVKYGDRFGVGMPLVLPVVDEDDDGNPVPAAPATAQAAKAAISAPRMSATSTRHLLTDEHSDDDDSVWEHATVPPLPPAAHSTMVALYDYDAEDTEELSFVAGDVLTQLEAEDSQGWAKGMDKAGQVGFYPAHYVEGAATSSNS